MKVLIACEESQEVCKAFRSRGHEAYSCDVQEPSGGHPEWHILGDALEALNGGIRYLAKLFSNNLYGKTAASPDSSFKVAYVKDDSSIGFYPNYAQDKTPGYIAIGAAITSYARCYTIRAAQANYEHFCYADTDSIHLNCSPEEVKGITEHPRTCGCWKCESEWDYGLFQRQKTYVEHVLKENHEVVQPHYDLKCAGMPQRSKKLFLQSCGEDEGICELC